MVDDETTRRRSRYAGPFDAFHRALGSTVVACDQLGAAIRRRDVADAERASSDAVDSWLTMRPALRKLELDAVDTGQLLAQLRLSLAIANDECGGRSNNDPEKDPSSEA
jgi:hypothetical protein